ncbi:peroxisomal biogenesis factor 11 [Dentipellis sp. KUC8613]|nr:peroxisomal biogenesis factor 11 [Dentipellis sp. KUC8613]
MSTLASQVILHPTVSAALKVLATTNGRDKLYRAVQYFSRFYAWYLISRGQKLNATRWNALKSHLALGRKLMRVGRPIENLQTALRAAQTSGRLGEQLTTIARNIGYFGYLSYDSVSWANTVRFITLKPETAAKVNKTAARLWLAGILFSIAHGVIKTGRLTQEASELRSLDEKDIGGQNVRQTKLQALEQIRAATRQQFLIDILDVWIPASTLGLANLNDGIVGIFGFISSALALRTQWAKVNGK